MALTATMIPDREIKAHPRRSRERPGEKKIREIEEVQYYLEETAILLPHIT